MSEYPIQPEVGQVWKFIGWPSEEPIIFRITTLVAGSPANFYKGEAINMNTREEKAIIFNDYIDLLYMRCMWVFVSGPHETVSVNRLELIGD